MKPGDLFYYEKQIRSYVRLLVSSDESIILASHYTNGPTNINLETPRIEYNGLTTPSGLATDEKIIVVNSLWPRIIRRARNTNYLQKVLKLIWGKDV